MEQTRERYKWSICSTCKFLSFCQLTTDKKNISSCSEYIHYMEGYKKMSLFERTQGMMPKANEELNNSY